jgi:3-deoxy-D-manno-octulosonic-acid transferase
VLRQLDLIAVQTDAYAERFRQLGAEPSSVVVTGSLKFDGAELDRLNPRTTQLRQLAAIGPNDVVWLAGSTFPPEEELVLRVYQQVAADFPQLRLVLVPRHPERFAAVAELLDRSGLTWARRSRLGDAPTGARILLVDTIGELGAWWGMADLAFVGGSMGPRGGQNMIEPAGYGAAICFGPRTTNFRDVVQAMLHQRAAEVVHDAQQLAAFLRRGLQDPASRAAMGQRARALVQHHAGATRRTADRLLPLLPAPLPLPHRELRHSA